MVEADGTADLSAADGVVVVKVEAVYGDDVIRRAYVKAYVNYYDIEYPGIYYAASASATVKAARVAFEVADFEVWAKALKDAPDTIERLKGVANVIKEIATILAGDEAELQKLFLIKEQAMIAYELLNGVPGFVYQYHSYTGYGEAIVQANFLPEVMSVREFKAVLEMIEEAYPQAAIGTMISNYIPQSLKSYPVIAGVLAELEDFTLSDLLEYEIVINLLETGQEIAESLGFTILDYNKINQYLTNLVTGIVGENNYGEAAAELSAKAKARAAAEEMLNAHFEELNEKVLSDLGNGTWKDVVKFLEVDLNLEDENVAKILEFFQVTDYAIAFEEILHQIIDETENLVTYTYDQDDIKFEITKLERLEVK